MLRSYFSLVMAIHILGPLWSLLASAMIVAGGVGLAHIVWRLLLTATAPL